MATQVIQTKFQTVGAKEAAAATNTVGKAQTRLGQSSASAGRQFSAQANGLGGLVGAYAGAAANIFAITAAFTALKAAAEFDVIIAGTNALASSIGASGNKILASVQEITKAQLSLSETAKTVNIGLAAGFNTTQIDQLSDVSLRASKALGRSLTDAFTRVSRGAAKLEPELLDELGIFTRIDPAVRKYADSVGRSVSSLTNFERRQAFVNAVIEEGSQKFRDVDVTTSTAAESFEKLSATIINLGLRIGSLLASGLAPLADFISGNLSNALAGFGLLASIVGARAISALSAGILTVTTSIVNLGTRTATFANSFSRDFKVATKALTDFNNANLLVIRSNSLNAQSINQKLIALQADIAAGRLKTKSELEVGRAVLQTAIAEGNLGIQRSKSAASIAKQRVALRTLLTEYTKLNAAINASSAASNIASVSFTKISKGVGIFGAILSRVVGGLLSFVTYASLAQIALDGLAKLFGFEGFSILEKLVGFLKAIIDSFTKITKELKGFAGSFRSELLEAANSAGAFEDDATKAVNKAINEFTNFNKIFARIADNRGAAKQLAVANEELEKSLRNLGESTKVVDQATLQVLNRLFELTAEFGIARGATVNLANTFTLLQKASGVAGRETKDFLLQLRAIDGVLVDVDQNSALLSIAINGLSTEYQRFNGKNLEFRAGFQDIAATLNIAADKINDFDEGIKNGTFNAEKAAQAVGAIGSAISDLDSQFERVERQIFIDEIRAANAEGSLLKQIELRIDDLKAAQKVNKAARDRLKVEQIIRDVTAGNVANLEKQVKLFDKVFGKPGEKIEQSVFSGELTTQGFATSQSEKDLNRVERLNKLILEGTDAQKRNRNEVDKINTLTVSITKANEKLSGINSDILRAEAAGVGNNAMINSKKESQKRLAFEIKGLQEDQAEQVKLIVARNSEDLQKIKLKKDALVALVVEQETLLGIASNALKLEKEAGKARLDNFKQLQKFEELIERENLRAVQRRTKIDEQRLETQKKALEGLGLLDDQASAQFAAAGATLELERAKADRDFQIAQLDRQEAFAVKQRELERNTFEKEIAIRETEINTQLDLIDALQGLTLSLTNAERKAAGLDRVQTLPGFKDTQTLRDSIKGSFSTIKDLGEDTFDLLATNSVLERDLKIDQVRDSYDILFKGKNQEIALQKLFSEQSVKIFKGIAEVVRDNLSTSINEFFDAVAQGTITLNSFKEGFKEFLRSTFEGIRKTILEETLIKPAQQKATKFLAGAFGLDIDQKPAVVSTSEGSAQLVKIAGEQGTDDQLKKILQDGVGGEKGFFEGIFDKLKTGFTGFGETVQGIFSQLGGSVSNIFSSVLSSLKGVGGGLMGGGSSLFSGLFGGIFGGGASSTFMPASIAPDPFASGGSVRKFAAGGSMRDRVPALLEPGEFVVRKQAAKVAGPSNLASLNATGQMGGGNVSVNVTNTGTPQTAEASQPRFDGEKMVIDIVMRDLSTNGPIRRSLRAGGAS